jgi:hypothetical protein
VSVIEIAILIHQKRPWGEFLINRRKAPHPGAEWHIRDGGPHCHLGNRPTLISNALVLYALHESNESDLKCEEQRGKSDTNRDVQQAPARLTPTMSPDEQ